MNTKAGMKPARAGGVSQFYTAEGEMEPASQNSVSTESVVLVGAMGEPGVTVFINFKNRKPKTTICSY